MLLFPQFNPVALQLGPIAIHWYGLAYIVALLGGLFYAKRLAHKYPAPGITPESIDNFFTYAVLGVILGGRIGYVLFYNPGHFMAHPLDALKVWQGGMSFHGGTLGVILATLLFSWKNHISPFQLGDRIIVAAPLGMLLGRLANFINGELVGRTTSTQLPWSMVFPHVDLYPRHPSQLYEAALEGALLLAILLFTTRKHLVPYQPVGIFLTGYALARIFVENFRTPEIIHTLGSFTFTQGQLLSLPMLAAGLIFLYISSKKRPV